MSTQRIYASEWGVFHVTNQNSSGQDLSVLTAPNSGSLLDHFMLLKFLMPKPTYKYLNEIKFYGYIVQREYDYSIFNQVYTPDGYMGPIASLNYESADRFIDGDYYGSIAMYDYPYTYNGYKSTYLNSKFRLDNEVYFYVRGSDRIDFYTPKNTSRQPYIEFDFGENVSLTPYLAGDVYKSQPRELLIGVRVGTGSLKTTFHIERGVAKFRNPGETAEHAFEIRDGKIAFDPSFITGNIVEYSITAYDEDNVEAHNVWANSAVLLPDYKDLTPSDGAFVDNSDWSNFLFRMQDKDGSDVTMFNSVLHWSADDNIWHEIAVGNVASGIKIPPNTFPNSDRIRWYMTGSTESGYQMQSDTLSFTTIDTLATAEVVSPKNVVIDSSAENEFAWKHITATGSQPTGYDIQILPQNLSEWQDLASAQSRDQFAVIPAGTLPTGKAKWRVRSYNTEGDAGEWSEPAEVSIIGAPDAPTLSVSNTSARFELQWGSEGQTGYEISIDGVTALRRYGSEKRYKYDKLLPIGAHTVRVRVQNNFGSWSEWTAAVLQITADSDERIDLSAQPVDNAVALKWNSADEIDTYFVYRNGELIAKTGNNALVDNFATSSTANYYVDGYSKSTAAIGRSDTVSAAAKIRTLAIYGLKAKKWISLKLSDIQTRTTTIMRRRDASSVYAANALYPDVYLSPSGSKSYSFDAAFVVNASDRLDFEALLGDTVILHDAYGNVICGVLTDMRQVSNHMISVYSVTLLMSNESEVDING